MRAITYSRTGDASVLTLEDVPTPEPEAGEVRIRVVATSVNVLDAKLRSGRLRYPQTFPVIPGMDARASWRCGSPMPPDLSTQPKPTGGSTGAPTRGPHPDRRNTRRNTRPAERICKHTGIGFGLDRQHEITPSDDEHAPRGSS